MKVVLLAALAGTLASAQLHKAVLPAHDLARRQATATAAATGSTRTAAAATVTNTLPAATSAPAASSGVPTGGSVSSKPLASL